MHPILVIGGGKIGSLISYLLSHSGQYHVHLADVNTKTHHIKSLRDLPNFTSTTLNANDLNAILQYVKQHQLSAIVSSLPFHCNAPIAKLASEQHLHYFDLTEDVKTTEAVQAYAKNANSAFVPQCGLAPGFISIVANEIMRHFTSLDIVKMRVGALPINISNALQYSLTWSTDGLINEYGNHCHAIDNGHAVTLLPLEGLEEIKIDGLTYEAFNTSGGIGSLAHTYHGRINHLTYKTIRYPGHCAKIRFLMNDLRLNSDRETLKKIFEHAIPKTHQDVVLVYVSVTGEQDGQYIEENYVKKFYPKKIGDHQWSAIQLTTASGITAVIDIVMNAKDHYRGFIRQEQFLLNDILQNQFGRYFAS